MSDSLRPHESQHARLPCPSPTPGVQSNSSASSQWCLPAISSSVIPFSSCPQSLPAPGSSRKPQIVFQSGCTISHSHQQHVSDPISLHPHQYLVVLLFYFSHVYSCVANHHTMVLICIFLMANNGECLFMCLFFVCMFSLVKRHVFFHFPMNCLLVCFH